MLENVTNYKKQYIWKNRRLQKTDNNKNNDCTDWLFMEFNLIAFQKMSLIISLASSRKILALFY